MIVVVETGRFEPHRLLGCEHAKRGAGLEPKRLHPLNHRADLVEVALLRLAPGRPHAETAGAGGARGARLSEHSIEAHQLLRPDAGLVMRAPRAIGTILRAAA